MAAPQGLFAFPTIQGVMSGSVSISHGVSPALIRIRAPMQSGPFASIGTLVISYGAKAIYLPHCRLVKIDVATTADGFQVLDFLIEDRRWKWRFGNIRGRYNFREGMERKLKMRWELEPHKLAKLCFEAMGESKYDLSQLPNEARPDIDWNCLPAEALTRLCESLGCHVVYDPSVDKARIVRIGQGNTLPLGDIISDSLSIDAPERPDEFRLICAPTQWEMDIAWEPVAEEVIGAKKGEIVPIDQVSYKPNGGWENDSPPDWPNVVLKYREAAKQDIFRLWRPKLPIKHEGQNIQSRNLLKLYDHAVEPRVIDKTWIKEPPPLLFGEFWDGEPNLKPQEKWVRTANGVMARFNRGFDLDTERNLLRTSEPLYVIAGPSGKAVTVSTAIDLATTKIKAANLFLRVAASVRDMDSHALIAHELVKKSTGPKFKTKPHYIQRDDIWEAHWASYDTGSAIKKNNLTALDKHAMNYLLEEIARWQLLQPGTRVYAGLVPFSPDGAISEWAFSVEESGYCKTTLSRNTERPQFNLTYDEKREIQLIQQNLKLAAQSGIVKPPGKA